MRYCSRCGTLTREGIPEGDDHIRMICGTCGHIHYDNPKMVVGCVPEWEGRILMARRSIEPKKGEWTLPAGYLENGETVEAGARREVMEEVEATVGEMIPYAFFNLPQIAQMYLIFRAPMVNDQFSAGIESLEVALFEEEDIPWDKLAFNVVEKTLKRYLEDRKTGNFPFFIDNVYFKDLA